MSLSIYEGLGIIFFVIIITYALAHKYLWSKKLLIILFLICNAIYLIWRTFYSLPTINLISIIAGIILLITEWAGYLQSIVFSIVSWKPYKRKEVPLSTFEKLPTVDIFIATYNEPIDLLKRTVAGCTLITYPKELLNIYICDDGRRESVKQLAADFSVHHITRTENKHAKAGNLNHAMLHSKGDIIVTMDADMIPRANFLERTIGYFSKNNVVFVQAPQVFYNADPFQYNLFFEDNIANEQDFFMRQLEEGKDRFNATMYVGSNALFRRTALEEIGGFATGVITEDMATGMLLQANKWETIFVNETLAVGLSPETFSDLLKQRDRWCRGNIQVVKKWNPFTIKGLSFMQRLLYADGIHYWFFGVYKMIFLLAPLLFLVFDIYSLEINFMHLFMFWAPAFLTSQLIFKAVSNKKRTTTWSHVYEVAMAPYMGFAILSEIFLRKKFQFHVTRKGVQNNTRHFLWIASIPHLILLILTIIALIRATLMLLYPEQYHIERESLYINIFWLLYNGIAIVTSLFVAFERPRFRNSERFVVNLPGTLYAEDMIISCNILDISETGARFELDSSIPFETLSSLSSYMLSFGEVEKIYSTKKWIRRQESSVQVGVSFDDVSHEQYCKLILHLFSKPVNDRVEKVYDKAFLTLAIASFIKNTKKAPRQFRRQHIREQLMSPGTLHMNGMPIEATIIDYSTGGCQVQTNIPLVIDQIIQVTMEERNIQKKNAQVCWIQKKGRKIYAGLKFTA